MDDLVLHGKKRKRMNWWPINQNEKSPKFFLIRFSLNLDSIRNQNRIRRNVKSFFLFKLNGHNVLLNSSIKLVPFNTLWIGICFCFYSFHYLRFEKKLYLRRVFIWIKKWWWWWWLVYYSSRSSLIRTRSKLSFQINAK